MLIPYSNHKKCALSQVYLDGRSLCSGDSELLGFGRVISALWPEWWFIEVTIGDLRSGVKILDRYR
jgi:hypothetical protein